MIEIIRKEDKSMILLSELKVGDTFRFGERIYILIEKSGIFLKDLPLYKGVCLSTGKVTPFCLGTYVMPVDATLIGEDVKVETNKEIQKLEELL